MQSSPFAPAQTADAPPRAHGDRELRAASSEATPPSRCDVAVVGGGILGLSVAREIVHRRPGASVCLLEREARVAAHQSSHNSGVIHAGVYYRPGSLKAQLCVAGARQMYSYCEQRDIAHQRCGKLIVAVKESELPGLDELARRADANGVPGLRRVDAAGIRKIEPHCRGVAALHSPNTGVVDYAEVSRALADDLVAGGGTLATSCEVTDVVAAPRSLRLVHAKGAMEATNAIFCAGAWADRLAVLAGADADPRIVPFRGSYLRLVPERAALVRALIYPVPDPALPFLGVHLTRHIDGEVTIGPSALPVGARDAYRLSKVRARDLGQTLMWPGSWRMAARWWRRGVSEISHATSPASMVRAARAYVPELAHGDTQRSFAGVRAQAVDRRGRLLDDFVFSATGRALHVRNAPSPAASASLAIASHVVDEAAGAFSW